MSQKLFQDMSDLIIGESYSIHCEKFGEFTIEGQQHHYTDGAFSVSLWP
jgi:hypothetical protein